MKTTMTHLRRTPSGLSLERFVVLALLAAFAGFACDAASGDPAGVVSSDNSVVYGTVSGTGGSVIGNAVVSARGVESRTNDQGWFVLSDVAPGERVVVTARAQGYTQKLQVVRLRTGESVRVTFALTPLQATQSVDSATGGTVTTATGSVDLPAGGFVDETGAPVAGAVDVEVSMFNIQDATDMGAAPGDFIGIDSDGQAKPIESFGFLYVNLRQGDTAVQLAPGATATIRMTIAERLRDTAPDPVPLWSYDEDRGVWILEGTGTRDGDSYVAQVTHFTWYNWDVVYGPATLTGRIIDGEGNPLPSAWAQHLGVTYNGGQRVFADAEGRFSMPVRADAQVHLWAEYQGVTSDVRTEATPPADQSRDIGDLVVVNAGGPLNVLLTLAWGAEPSDLDSHLWLPGADGAPYGSWIYYSQKGTLDGHPFTKLDTDDTSSFGPEVISITRLVAGTYRYCIYNFSGAPDISLSQGKVTYLDNWGGLRVLTAPTLNENGYRWWKIMEMSVAQDGGRPSPSFVNRYVPDTECDPRATFVEEPQIPYEPEDEPEPENPSPW